MDFINSDADVIVFCANWIDQGQTNTEMVNYWLNRLHPIALRNRQVNFLCSNRIGEEHGTKYVGSSCIVQLDTITPRKIKILEKDEENILIQKLVVK